MRVVFTATLFAALLVSLSPRAEAQQSWASLQTPIAGEVKGVSVPRPGAVVAVGEEGAIVRSEDGGTTWKKQQSTTDVTLWAVHFWSADSGVVAGDGGTILTTSNGGTTWTRRPSGLDTSARSFLFGVAMRGDTLIAVGGELSTYSSAILTSTDRGITWSKKLLGESLFLDRIVFIDASTMVAVGMHLATTGGGIYRTTDGGTTWVTVHQSSELITSVASVGNRVIAVGSGGMVYASDDGGATWPSAIPVEQYDLLDVTLDSRGNGVVVGDAGTVLATHDSGATWTTISIDNGSFLSDATVDPTDGAIYAAGFNGVVYRSTLIADVAEEMMPPLDIRSEERQIVVETGNVTDDISVAVYDLLGRSVATARLAAGVTRIPVAGSGVYLVICRNAHGGTLKTTTVTVAQ